MEDLRLGNLLVKARLLSREDLSRCLEMQGMVDPSPPLGQLLLELNLVDGGILSHMLMMQATRRATKSQSKLPGCSVDEILRAVEQTRASEVILSTGRPVLFRISGNLQPVSDFPVQDEDIHGLVRAAVSNEEAAAFILGESITTDCHFAEVGPARIAAIRHGAGLAVNIVANPIPTEQLIAQSTPTELVTALSGGPGLGLVGSRDSHLAQEALEYIARSVLDGTKLVTVIGDSAPIARHTGGDAIVVHRRICVDTGSFESALRHAMEDPPDVVVVTEAEQIGVLRQCLALTSIGVRVIAGIYSGDVASAFYRLAHTFECNEERQSFVHAVQALVGYESLPEARGMGNAIASECLVVNDAVRGATLDRDQDPTESRNIIRGARCRSLTESLVELVANGTVRYEDAFDYAEDVQEIIKASPHNRVYS